MNRMFKLGVLAMLAAACAFAGSSIAEEAMEAALTEVEGEVTLVDVNAGTVTVAVEESAEEAVAEAEDQTESFQVTEETWISDAQGEIELTDIQPGDQIAIEYAQQGGKMQAYTIRLLGT